MSKAKNLLKLSVEELSPQDAEAQAKALIDYLGKAQAADRKAKAKEWIASKDFSPADLELIRKHYGAEAPGGYPAWDSIMGEALGKQEDDYLSDAEHAIDQAIFRLGDTIREMKATKLDSSKVEKAMDHLKAAKAAL